VPEFDQAAGSAVAVLTWLGAGAFIGTIIGFVLEEYRTRRNIAREDRARWAADKREVYARYLAAIDVLREQYRKRAREVRMAAEGSPGDARLDLEPAYRGFREVDAELTLLASDEVRFESTSIFGFFLEHRPDWLGGDTWLQEEERAARLGEAEAGIRFEKMRSLLVEVMRLDLQVPAFDRRETERYEREVERRNPRY
jgi:hypothetical protein